MGRALAVIRRWAWFAGLGLVSGQAQTPEIAIRGVVFQGKDTYVALVSENPRESEWIRVGGVFRDVELVGYDKARDVATLRHAGQVFERSLFGSVQATAELRAQQAHEVEKGMLVADLLEIGMEHRRRLREAAAQEAARNQR